MRPLILFAALIAVATSVACKGKGETPTGPGPVPMPNSTINYTAIGASDAIGFGSSAVCTPFSDCPNGRGYVQVATRELRARGFTVNHRNYGIPASVISRRVGDLGAQYGHQTFGNFLEQQAPFVTPDTTLVTIFAGANDVNTVTAALGGGAGAADQTAFINSQVQLFGQDFAALLRIVRERAPAVRIIAFNLPNMGAIPLLANAPLQHRRAAQMLTRGMTTTVINPSTSSGVMVVDLMCDPRSYQSSTYSSDGFHPSDAGYAWMAGEVVAAATSQSYRAPASSCSQMTLVP
ncbi:MAG TPA: SGNH/GDSL hydrolase family protein [Vicinamibacterales bacterium]|nr:SGNH/GDSL hydrolase family protein [Vicinamibacterales bacterium]